MGTVNLGEPTYELSMADGFPQREAQGCVLVIQYTKIKAGLIERGRSRLCWLSLVWLCVPVCVAPMCTHTHAQGVPHQTLLWP